MMHGSWRTSSAAIMAALSAVVMAIVGVAGGETVDWNHVAQAVFAAATAVGLLSARDNKVSSEEAGAKQPTEKGRGLGGPGGGIGTGASFALALVLMLAISGCVCERMLPVDDVSPAMTMVADRHDAYVLADPTLSDADREVFLRTTELLRVAIDEAEAEGAADIK